MSKKTIAILLTLLVLMLAGIILLFLAACAVENGSMEIGVKLGLGGTACCVPYMVYMR